MRKQQRERQDAENGTPDGIEKRTPNGSQYHLYLQTWLGPSGPAPQPLPPRWGRPLALDQAKSEDNNVPVDIRWDQGPVRFPSSSLSSAIDEFPALIAYVAMIN